MGPHCLPARYLTKKKNEVLKCSYLSEKRLTDWPISWFEKIDQKLLFSFLISDFIYSWFCSVQVWPFNGITCLCNLHELRIWKPYNYGLSPCKYNKYHHSFVCTGMYIRKRNAMLGQKRTNTGNISKNSQYTHIVQKASSQEQHAM